jgi:hypothetical protein
VEKLTCSTGIEKVSTTNAYVIHKLALLLAIAATVRLIVSHGGNTASRARHMFDVAFVVHSLTIFVGSQINN